MPCQNGGTCISTGNEGLYRCMCSNLYDGDNCEMLKEEDTVVELESSGDGDDLTTNTTVETETAGDVTVTVAVN